MDLKDEYKKETGDYVHFRETESGNKFYKEDYVKWVEDRLVKLLPIRNVRQQREMLVAFFKFFRDNGEANIGMTIEQFVDAFLATNSY